MGLIYVPERKISATFSPDFPVEARTDIIHPVHLWHPQPYPRDLVGNAHAYHQGQLSQLEVGRSGRSVYSTGGSASSDTGYYADPETSNLSGLNALTVFAVVTFNQTSGGVETGILRCESTGGAAYQYAIDYNSGTQQLYLLLVTNGTTGWTSSVFVTIPQPTAGIPYVVVGKWVSGGYIYISVTPMGETPVWLTASYAVTGSISESGSGSYIHVGGMGYYSNVTAFIGNVYLGGVLPYSIDPVAASALTQNPFGVALRPRQRALMIPVGSGGTVALDSSTTATGTGTGTLSVEIPIQSSSVAVASGSGILSQSIPMAASATATVTGTGDLQIAIPLDASAIATAAGSASMSIAQALAGSGTASGIGTGTLSTNGQMSGSGTAAGTGGGTISLSIALSASAIAQAVGSGELSLSGSLSGSGTASGTGIGNLTQTIPLVASSLATVSGTGTMVNSVPLTSSAVVNASGMGMLGVQIGFSAHAFADAISTGNMTLILRLSGQAVAQAVGSGALSQSGILQANPRYTINAL